MKTIFLLLLLIPVLSLSPKEPQKLKESLTFYASFDRDAEADYARGDARIYTATDYDQLPEGEEGIHSENISLATGKGVSGDALSFIQKSKHIVFYKAKENMAYREEGWSGTVSFWLQLNPDTDLEPGYCDPIQITDEDYNDAALWVDFSDKNPRSFRMGVYGDLKDWNPEGIEGAENPEFAKRLVPSKSMPFSRQRWTHVLIRFADLNTQNGSAELYLNAELQGKRENVSEAFSWEPEQATIRLGLSYVGLLDELAIFDRALSQEEIQVLYSKQEYLKNML